MLNSEKFGGSSELHHKREIERKKNSGLFKSHNNAKKTDDGDYRDGGESAGTPAPVRKINYEKLESVTGFCDTSLELLKNIEEQTAKIIEYKKKKSAAAGERDDVFRRQLVGFILALENLVKINNSIKNAADQVKNLCVKANKLLGKDAVHKKGAGMSLGGGSTAGDEEEGDDAR